MFRELFVYGQAKHLSLSAF